MSVRVRMPNGNVLRARLDSGTKNGYRKASVRVNDETLGQVRVSGRVSARHGFGDDRVLKFEVNALGENAGVALRGAKEAYVS